MNWFPSFLSPWAAAVAAGVAVPLLVLLYFLKLRRREMAVASTYLWKKAVQDLQVNAPFQRLRRNLLLLLQLLALAAILLAMARPMAQLAPRAGATSVILIDRSASMNARDMDGRTRLEVARQRARDLVGTMPRNASAMVIAFDRSATTVQSFTADAQALRNAIDSIEPTDRGSSLRQAYQLAEAQSAAFAPEQLRSNAVRPDAWLFSDGRVTESADLSLGANLRFEPLGDRESRDDSGNVLVESQTPNVAVVALSARRNYERPNEVQVFARLANFGPQPVQAPVELSVAAGEDLSAEPVFRVQGAASATLLPDRWTPDRREQAERDGLAAKEGVGFTIELTTAAVVRVQIQLAEPDALAADDGASVVVPPPRAVRAVHVTDGENPFMEKVLESLGLASLQTMTPGQYEAAVPTDADIILFDRHSPARLPDAGSFLFFGGLPPDSALTAELLNGKAVLEPDVGILDWDRDHPILRGLGLGRIFAAESLRLRPPLEAQVLVEGTKGPLIVRLQEGRRTHLVVGFDTLQSNWPTRPSFPVFVYNAIQFLALGTEMAARESLAPGDTATIPRASIAQVDPDLRSFELIGPDRTRTVEVRPDADVVLPALDRVGIYRTSPPIPGFERLAVNLTDPNESNLIPAETAPGGVGEVLQAASGPARTELWRWILAFVAVPLLLVEWWVYTRRVHL